MLRISRRTAASLTGLTGVAVLVTTLPTWVSGSAPTATGDLTVSAAGTTVAPGTASIALVILAAGAVLGLAGRVLRVLALLGVIAGAILAALNVFAFLAAPEVAAASAAAEVTSVRAINEPVAVTVWPYLCLAVLAIGAGLGVWFLTRLGSWQAVGRRFETRGAPPPAEDVADSRTRARRQAMDDWDALSRGEDPSGSSLD